MSEEGKTNQPRTLDEYRLVRVMHFMDSICDHMKTMGSRSPRLAPLVKVGLEEWDLLGNMVDLLWKFFTDIDKVFVGTTLTALNRSSTDLVTVVGSDTHLTTQRTWYNQVREAYVVRFSSLKDFIIQKWESNRDALKQWSAENDLALTIG